MKILVTGGTGYIGSHTICDLVANGFDVLSIDNYARSKSDTIDLINQITTQDIANHAIDLCNKNELFDFFKRNSDIEGIIHFAALKSVPESVAEPLKYYNNNIESLVNLLEACEQFSIPNFVFSSSCSVYGNVAKLPVTEDTPFSKAESPYAHTKQIGEEMIQFFSKTTKTNFVLLRYFNPVGAHISGIIGENPSGEVMNIVPRITGTALGKYPKFMVFGNDYPTRDGTCIRDYIHVMDIAAAHTKALKYLFSGRNQEQVEVFNLGTGNGVSTLEIIKSFEQVSGHKLNYEIAERRAGDVVAIYANNDKAKSQLGWDIKYSLDDMMRTAWNWDKKNVLI
jgi:UDP-glucose 4-epimerase